jgi:hypothetical protein
MAGHQMLIHAAPVFLESGVNDFNRQLYEHQLPIFNQLCHTLAADQPRPPIFTIAGAKHNIFVYKSMSRSLVVGLLLHQTKRAAAST